MTEVQSTEDLILAYLEGDDPRAMEEMIADDPTNAQWLLQMAVVEQVIGELPMAEKPVVSRPKIWRYAAMAAALAIFFGIATSGLRRDVKAPAVPAVASPDFQGIAVPGPFWSNADPFALTSLPGPVLDHDFAEFSLFRPLPPVPRTWEDISIFNFSLQDENNLTQLQIL